MVNVHVPLLDWCFNKFMCVSLATYDWQTYWRSVNSLKKGDRWGDFKSNITWKIDNEVLICNISFSDGFYEKWPCLQFGHVQASVYMHAQYNVSSVKNIVSHTRGEGGTVGEKSRRTGTCSGQYGIMVCLTEQQSKCSGLNAWIWLGKSIKWNDMYFSYALIMHLSFVSHEFTEQQPIWQIYNITALNSIKQTVQKLTRLSSLAFPVWPGPWQKIWAKNSFFKIIEPTHFKLLPYGLTGTVWNVTHNLFVGV